MTLYQIDPQARTIEPVETEGGLDELVRLLDCRLIDVCARQDNRDALVVDDEALYNEPLPPAFRFAGYGPIHGPALLTGCNDEGETTTPAYSLAEARARIKWLGEVQTKPQMVVLGWDC
jgi:hypothetical protein